MYEVITWRWEIIVGALLAAMPYHQLGRLMLQAGALIKGYPMRMPIAKSNLAISAVLFVALVGIASGCDHYRSVMEIIGVCALLNFLVSAGIVIQAATNLEKNSQTNVGMDAMDRVVPFEKQRGIQVTVVVVSLAIGITALWFSLSKGSYLHESMLTRLTGEIVQNGDISHRIILPADIKETVQDGNAWWEFSMKYHHGITYRIKGAPVLNSMMKDLSRGNSSNSLLWVEWKTGAEVLVDLNHQVIDLSSVTNMKRFPN